MSKLTHNWIFSLALSAAKRVDAQLESVRYDKYNGAWRMKLVAGQEMMLDDTMFQKETHDDVHLKLLENEFRGSLR
jgi:hypothetical protein